MGCPASLKILISDSVSVSSQVVLEGMVFVYEVIRANDKSE